MEEAVRSTKNSLFLKLFVVAAKKVETAGFFSLSEGRSQFLFFRMMSAVATKNNEGGFFVFRKEGRQQRQKTMMAT